MHFTREPIVETVIMPREGCKLLVRSSKGSGQEEYYVDAVEVVSFGSSLFFRSQERPKAFLVPLSDYEVLEQREVRMSLKNAPPERSIKIGGGREMSANRPMRDETEPFEPQERERPEQQQPMDRDRKRDKRRRGRRGGVRSEMPMSDAQPRSSVEGALSFDEQSTRHKEVEAEVSSAVSPGVEEQKAPSFISKLFPPPPTLIKETLSRYKTAETEEEVFRKREEKLEETLFDVPFPEEDISDVESERDDEPPSKE